MTSGERRAALSLAAIFALRMLGLFMILPVFALYTEHLAGVTPTLVGIAIGAYGLTQALFQIPFGMLSDRLGRKPVIVAGLLIFAAGSLLAAQADTLWGVIAGRALQGAGAIAAAVMALLADLVREEHRVKAMASFGASIGFAFALSLVLGPLLGHWIGVPGIFELTAVLALGGIGVLLFAVPNAAHSHFHRDAEPVPGQFRRVLADRQLLRLDFGILVLHLTLTATFVVLPLALRQGLPAPEHWKVYLPVMLLAMGLMVPFIVVAEKRRRMKQTLVGAIGVLALAQALFALFHAGTWMLAALLLLFFAAFNVLEASLPSLIAKSAPADAKGTAMGVYSTSQFLGAFVGGAAGGWLHGAHGFEAVFLFNAVALGLWLLAAATMAPPSYLATHMLHVGPLGAEEGATLTARLLEIPGVAEVVVVGEEEAAYLKVDRERIDWAALEPFSAA